MSRTDRVEESTYRYDTTSIKNKIFLLSGLRSVGQNRAALDRNRTLLFSRFRLPGAASLAD